MTCGMSEAMIEEFRLTSSKADLSFAIRLSGQRLEIGDYPPIKVVDLDRALQRVGLQKTPGALAAIALRGTRSVADPVKLLDYVLADVVSGKAPAKQWGTWTITTTEDAVEDVESLRRRVTLLEAQNAALRVRVHLLLGEFDLARGRIAAEELARLSPPDDHEVVNRMSCDLQWAEDALREEAAVRTERDAEGYRGQ